MSPAKKWIAAIVGLLSANVLASVVLATTAARGASEVIPDYYESGVHYDDAIDRAATNARLGWPIDAHVDRGAIVVATIAGATVSVSGYPRAHARERFAATLVDGRAAVAAHGICDVEIAVARGTDRMVVHRVLELP